MNFKTRQRDFKLSTMHLCIIRNSKIQAMKKTTFALMVSTLAVITILLSFTNKTETKSSVPENKTVLVDGKSVNLMNLKDAYKAEIISSAKYAAYSEKAEEEGHHQIAMMFNALSKAKGIHADNHQAVLEDAGETVPEVDPKFEVRSTKQNLEDAIAEEDHKISTMYPKFITNADNIGDLSSLESLNYAHKTALKHKDYHARALVALENNNVESLSSAYFVCPTCGNIFDSDIPEQCDVSMTPSEDFIEVSDQSW